MARTTCCQGTYHRTHAGVWCYPWGAPVPGARDLTVRGALRLAGCPTEGPLTPELLAWARQVQGIEGLQVTVTADPFDQVVGMEAPELAPTELLSLDDLARRVGASRATTDSRVVRGHLPSHQLVLDGGRRWARPIVDRWLRTPPPNAPTGSIG